MFAALAVLIIGCKADENDTGIEYAPQMYHSIPYEPLTQITKEGVPNGPIESFYYEDFINSMPFTDKKGPSNSLEPVAGTIPRQFYQVKNTMSAHADTTNELMKYDLHKDSLNLAAEILKNPLPVGDEQLLAEGKELYLSFCSSCHGANGQGNGKVGEVYKGVPNYAVGRYATLPEGHIYHVITHGKGRMWAHKSQLSPTERWKVVRYVQKLQKGES